MLIYLKSWHFTLYKRVSSKQVTNLQSKLTTKILLQNIISYNKIIEYKNSKHSQTFLLI